MTAGYSTLKSFTPTTISAGQEEKSLLFQPGGVTIKSTERDGGNTGFTNRLRAGWPLAYNNTSKRHVLLKRTTTTTTGTVTDIVVVNSHAFKVGDTISVGADTGKVISAINYATHTLTIPSTAVASGEAVIVVGEETLVGFLPGETDLLDSDGSTYRDTEANLVVGGILNEAKLKGDLAAIKADASSVLALRDIKFLNSSGNVYSV